MELILLDVEHLGFSIMDEHFQGDLQMALKELSPPRIHLFSAPPGPARGFQRKEKNSPKLDLGQFPSSAVEFPVQVKPPGFTRTFRVPLRVFLDCASVPGRNQWGGKMGLSSSRARVLDSRIPAELKLGSSCTPGAQNSRTGKFWS